MALLADEYLSVPGGGEGIYKDRGSRFIARAYPVETVVAEKFHALVYYF